MVSGHTDGMLTVGQVAEKFGVTVRTLHHYDTIGLLAPSSRSFAGYRLYDTGDLDRLAAIVTYRRLGLQLDAIAEVMAGDVPIVDHLRRQRDAVKSRIGELTGIVDAIDNALERQMNRQPAAEADLKEIFGNGFDDDYAAEAEQRWSGTAAWEQGSARTSDYTRADWRNIESETDSVTAQFARVMQAGQPTDSVEAMDVAEAHRELVEKWFYDLDHEFHRSLGELYVDDPRFAQTFDDEMPGLAAYVRNAIWANADRHE